MEGQNGGYLDNTKHFIVWLCRHFNTNSENSLKQEIFSRKNQHLLQKGKYYFVQYIKEVWAILRQLVICTITSIYYYGQNPSGFCFLVQIRAFII